MNAPTKNAQTMNAQTKNAPTQKAQTMNAKNAVITLAQVIIALAFAVVVFTASVLGHAYQNDGYGLHPLIAGGVVLLMFLACLFVISKLRTLKV